MFYQFSAKRRAPHWHEFSPPYSSTSFASASSPSHHEISIPIDRHSGSLQMAKNRRRAQIEQPDHSRCQMTRIDVLPDDVLLEIFDFITFESGNTPSLKNHLSQLSVETEFGDFYMNRSRYDGGKMDMEAWQSLVHVCRRWRSLVLGSPRRLNLQLYCTPKTPARDTLDVWPALPLIVRGSTTLTSTDNVIAVLGQSNRVLEVILRLADWQSAKVFAAMQAPFPELTHLQLISDVDDETPPVIPESFLDGSAPRLRFLDLHDIPFPGLPNQLLSATHLVYLKLSNIPHSGYISPEAMVALLSVLSSLETLSLGFRSPQSHPSWEARRPPPPKRSILPALHEFRFKGVTEYLEDLVTFIDAPRLNILYITFFNQIDFDSPRLAQFVNCTPTLRALDEAHVQFNDSTASVTFRYRPPKFSLDDLLIEISCREPDWQLSSIEQVCNTSLHPLSIQDLYIEHRYSQLIWKDDAIENTLWLQLLLPFTAVKNLYLSQEFAPGIAAALQELVGGRITEMLPSLQKIFVQEREPLGPFREYIGQFSAARRQSGHPIAVSIWDTDSNMKPM